MNASITALVFVGLLLTVLGLFVAGNLAVVALGVVALLGAGLFQAVSSRSSR
jgi:hypothetical protein